MKFRLLGIFCGLVLLSQRVCLAGIVFPLKGEFDYPSKKFMFEINPGQQEPISVLIQQETMNKYTVSLALDHLSVKFFDISTILDGSLEVARDQSGLMHSLDGIVSSRYTLINYKPVQDFNGHFVIKDNILSLNALSFGPVICKGTIQIEPPFDLDLQIQVSDMELADFLAFFVDRKKIDALGSVSGQIRLTRHKKELNLEGDLISYDSIVNDLDYRSFRLLAKGIYPMLDISGSDVTKADGVTFTLAGNIDLSRKETIGRQIRSLIMKPFVREDGNNVEWTLKRIRTDEYSGSTELKYLRRRKEDASILSEGDTGILGLERKLEF